MHGFTVHHAHTVCTYSTYHVVLRIGCVRVYSEFRLICPSLRRNNGQISTESERLSKSFLQVCTYVHKRMYAMVGVDMLWMKQ